MVDTVPVSSDSSRHLPWSDVLLAGAAFLTIGILLFPSAGWDDAYITFWAAHALSDLGRIVNYNLQPVEQSSSLGFVVIVALARRLTGVDASIVGRLASMAFGLATVFASAGLGRALNPSVGRYAPAVLATSAYFVYWSFGGMETSLAAWSGVVLLICLTRMLDDGLKPAIVAATAAITLVYLSARPEHVFILCAVLVGLAGYLALRRLLGINPLIWEGHASRQLLVCGAVALAAICAVVAFRLWYFGLMFAQPVYAKSEGLARHQLVAGFRYLLDSIQSDFVLTVLLGGGAALFFLVPHAMSRARSSVGVVGGLFVCASLGFIVCSGGDGLQGGRFFVPMIPAAVVLGVGLLSNLPPKAFRAAVIAWMVVQVGGILAFARTRSHSDPVWAVVGAEVDRRHAPFNWFERANHDHRRYFPVVIELEKEIERVRTRKTPVTILSGQSGFVMYHVAQVHLGDLRYFDRFALASRDFLHCSVSARTPHSTWGLALTVEAILTRQDLFQRECGIAPPDIIYELFWDGFPPELDQTLKRAGYVLVYSQDHDFESGSRLFPGRSVGRAYIAVRQEYIENNGGSRGH